MGQIGTDAGSFMWILYAAGAAVFAGITSILIKCGIRQTDSNVATAIRTVVVLLFSWLLVFLGGTQRQLADISGETFLFLILSGGATGASWLCYFKALQLGDINKVVPVDKSSIILTILFAFLFLGESISWMKGIGILLIGLGTFLMIQKKKEEQNTEKKADNRWIFYAVMSAFFASLTAVLGKIGISGVDSNLGSAIRTSVVLVMAWMIVFVTKKTSELKKISGKELKYIGLSGIATGISWLCYYKALKDGITSAVVSIDKLSILVTVIFSWIIFKEKLSKKAFLGLALLVAGTLALTMVK